MWTRSLTAFWYGPGQNGLKSKCRGLGLESPAQQQHARASYCNASKLSSERCIAVLPGFTHPDRIFLTSGVCSCDRPVLLRLSQPFMLAGLIPAIHHPCKLIFRFDRRNSSSVRIQFFPIYHRRQILGLFTIFCCRCRHCYDKFSYLCHSTCNTIFCRF